MTLKAKGRSFRLGLLIAGLLAIASCRESGEEGNFFEISGKMFVFNYRVATATYLITLKPLQPMREGDVAVATFQDPAGGDDIVVHQKVWPKLDKVTLESPPLRCVVKDKPYNVAINIQDSAGAVKQTIKTTIISSEDQTLLPDRPLVVGPIYTPNPDLAGHPDGKLPSGQTEPCPPAA